MKTHGAFFAVGVLALILAVPGFAQDASKKGIAKEDAALLSFGKVIEAAAQEKLDWKNPHQVTAYAVWMCRQGKSKELVKEMGHVEKDAELGKALLSFIGAIGPDLERYKNKELYLRFHGYSPGKDTSVWYYWLTDKAGKNLEHSPWVSTHRSQRTQRCALTGIFLHDPDIKGSPGRMPEGLVTSSDKEK